ncbi:MAG: phosphosulfolactate synthase [Chloroflexota bacterium]|jgi:phosphosulfolactate synthase|nr:phosphosulfolactate synthase [Chloroflexota bacterium]
MSGTRFVPMLDLPERPSKPRRVRRTVIFDRGWPADFIEGVLEGFSDAIDIAKISAWHLHQTQEVVEKKLAMYKRHGIETMGGGPVLEIAQLQHKEDEVLDYLQELGFEGVEVSSESMPTQTDIEADRRLAEKCKARGFIIHGEVGKKFPGGDQTRTAAGTLDVDIAAATFEAYKDMGCDGSYLEGHVLRAICGDMAEKQEGWDSLVRLVERVGLEDIIFEIPGTFLHYAGKRALQGVLVYLFGPNVNMANILIEEVAEAEEIRDGTFPAFGVPNGDHPWIRSLALSGTGKAGDQWWRG